MPLIPPRRFLLLAATALLAMAPRLHAEPRFAHVERLSVENGLAHSTVWDIHQGSRGFLWFSTQDGLSRFDGYEIETYRKDPTTPHSLTDGEVLAIAEDSRGHLWLSTRSGFELFDRQEGRFLLLSSDSEETTPLRGDGAVSFFEDRKGTIWLGTSEGLYRYDSSDETFEHQPHPASDVENPGHSRIWSLQDDDRGLIWLGTDNGLDRFDPETLSYECFFHNPAEETSVGDDQILELKQDSHGILWIGTASGLYRYHEDSRAFFQANYAPGTTQELDDDAVFEIYESPSGDLWILTPSGPGRLDRARDYFVLYDRFRDRDAAVNGSELSEILEDADGAVWASSLSEGLFRLDRATGKWVLYQHDPSDANSLSNNSTTCLEQDSAGNLWIGSYSGANRYDQRRERFSAYSAHPQAGGLSSSAIWGVHEDARGDLWLGTYDRGLNRLIRGSTPEETTSIHYQPDATNSSSISHLVVTSISRDADGDLWIGTLGGLDHLDPVTGRIVHHRHDPEDENSLSSDEISFLYEDLDAALWVGTFWGVNRFDREQGRIQRYHHDPEDVSSLAPGPIYAILRDRAGTLWLGSMEGGLSRLRADGESFDNFRHDPEHPDSLGANGIAVVQEDSRGSLWIGTYGGGLNRFLPDSETFERFREADGLPSDAVLGILEASDGRLWLSTYKGLSRFDPATRTFRNFDAEDGLAGDVFSSVSSFRGASGELFFGGVNGLTAFFPEVIEDDPKPPEVVLTNFLLAGEEVTPGSGSPLVRPIEETAEIVLDHRQKTFSIEFAALHFSSPHKNRYSLQLEGFDETWIDADASQRSVRYTNLDPGTYTFRVRASNPDGVWSTEDASLKLRVLPPPWQTWWAYSLYALALASACLGYVHWQHRRIASERAISARLKEVDRLKDEFLANTSHELRTPLYGLTGLAESLLDGAGGELPASARANLEMIVSSGQRLTHLVNDILDFSKLSRKSLELNRQPIDLRKATEVVLALSQPLVGNKELALLNSVDASLPPVHADENRLHQILYNLVGNAIKFTESGRVEVSAVLDDELLTVRVTDTGIGISKEKQASIFESFEQADASIEREYSGTGLGLSISKQLVALHGGSIWLESEKDEGSTFFFTLPVADGRAETYPPSADAAADTGAAREMVDALRDDAAIMRLAAEAVEALPDAYSILIVDDEPVIRQVLLNYLKPRGYRLTQAASGGEALSKINEQSFDLILLDVMMPKMSGYEVCRQVREQFAAEQLPIVFLTAKSRTEDLVIGFEAGANDYLPKPVTKDELLARVNTHLGLLTVHRQLEKLVAEKVSELKVLQGLLPICASCKKIRDDEGAWNDLESYIDHHSEAEFSHGLCPDCVGQFLQDARAEAETA